MSSIEWKGAWVRMSGCLTNPSFGFEQFLLRGLQKVTLEWNLICGAYHLKRLHKLLKPANQKPKVPKTPKPTPSALGVLLDYLCSHLAWLFNEFLRAAEFEEPVETASGFRIK